MAWIPVRGVDLTRVADARHGSFRHGTVGQRLLDAAGTAASVEVGCSFARIDTQARPSSTQIPSVLPAAIGWIRSRTWTEQRDVSASQTVLTPDRGQRIRRIAVKSGRSAVSDSVISPLARRVGVAFPESRVDEPLTPTDPSTRSSNRGAPEHGSPDPMRAAAVYLHRWMRPASPDLPRHRRVPRSPTLGRSSALRRGTVSGSSPDRVGIDDRPRLLGTPPAGLGRAAAGASPHSHRPDNLSVPGRNRSVSRAAGVSGPQRL